MTLSERESTTMLSPASIDSAQKGTAPLLEQSDTILSARTPDLIGRRIWVEVCCENANHRSCLGCTGDCGGLFSVELSGRGAGRLVGMEGGGVSCGNAGDEGGDDVVGRRSAGTNEEVVVASDTCAVLEARTSEMLDFGWIGLNLPRCKAARTFSHDGRETGETFKRLSSSTRYERGNRREAKSVSRRGVLLNPGYDDTSRSSRSMSLPFPPFS